MTDRGRLAGTWLDMGLLTSGTGTGGTGYWILAVGGEWKLDTDNRGI